MLNVFPISCVTRCTHICLMYRNVSIRRINLINLIKLTQLKEYHISTSKAYPNGMCQKEISSTSLVICGYKSFRVQLTLKKEFADLYISNKLPQLNIPTV